MSATNGSAFSIRRLVGCLLALTLLGSALFASSASASPKTLTPTAYVAIGDSLAFGYKEATFDANQVLNKGACEVFDQTACEPASSFEPGYVGLFGKHLAAVEKHAGNALATINLGCPGETTNGMIGNGTLGTEIEAQRESESKGPLKVAAPCGYTNVDGFPLKTNLGGASELEAAAQIVGEGVAKVGPEVKAVTINMGSNDELASVAKCENPAYDAEQGFSSFTQCLLTEASLAGHEYAGGLFTHIIEGIGTSIGVLREAGYTGPVVVMGFYNPQAFALPGSDTLQISLNEAFEGEIAAKAFGPGVTYANPFPVFNYTPGKSAKREKANLEKYTEYFNAADKKVNLEKTLGHEVTAEEAAADPEGDIHPTAAGYTKMGSLAWKASGL
jgi:lysophospholipase L1-like esterase